MADNDLFLQMQADVLGIPVERPAASQVTALGIAYLAGLATGYRRDVSEIRATRVSGRTFAPGQGAGLQARYEVWQLPSLQPCLLRK